MSDILIAEPAALTVTRSRRDVRPVLQQSAYGSIFGVIAIAAVIAGLMVRHWAWEQTDPIHYQADINNAFKQGSETLVIGYVDRYDEQATHTSHSFMDLDYAPGRLAVATLWSRWVRQQVKWPIIFVGDDIPWPYQFYPYSRSLEHQNGKPSTYQLCRPMLMVNTTGELLSTVAMFFLVRRYTAGKAPRFRPVRGTVLGLIAALFFWFDPALIFNAHCWPQWDSWLLPFYLWALVLASVDWWFCAGALIATGAMFKGQILFGAPLFLLWPLFQWRLWALARWVVGVMTATAAITAVWLVRVPGTLGPHGHFLPGHTSVAAVEWVIYLALVFAAMVSLFSTLRMYNIRVPLSIVVAAVLSWLIGNFAGHIFSLFGFLMLAVIGWIIEERCATWNWKAKLPLVWLVVAILLCPIFSLSKAWVGFVLIAVVVMGALLKYAPRKVIPFAAAGWIAGALLMCTPIFNTSRGWFDYGIAYGTHHYEKMASGENNNLPELLQYRWQWDDLMAPAMHLPAGVVSDSIAQFLINVDPGVKLDREEIAARGIGLPLKYVLLTVWITSVVLCAVGAAVHDRNRSPRFLAAISAPWVMFFAVMTQMHQRYLLWGGSLTSATAIFSPGYAVLHLFLSIVAMSQELRSMIKDGPYGQNEVSRFLGNWHPGIAWAVLLSAAIFLYTAIKRDKPPADLLPAD